MPTSKHSRNGKVRQRRTIQTPGYRCIHCRAKIDKPHAAHCPGIVSDRMGIGRYFRDR